MSLGLVASCAFRVIQPEKYAKYFFVKLGGGIWKILASRANFGLFNLKNVQKRFFLLALGWLNLKNAQKCFFLAVGVWNLEDFDALSRRMVDRCGPQQAPCERSVQGILRLTYLEALFCFCARTT